MPSDTLGIVNLHFKLAFLAHATPESMMIHKSRAKEGPLSMVVLLAGLCAGCAFVPSIPLNIGTGNHIVQPEKGCIQGVYERDARRQKKHYSMIELDKDGIQFSRGPEYTRPLLRALYDDPEAYQVGLAARRSLRYADAAIAVGVPLSLGSIVTGIAIPHALNWQVNSLIGDNSSYVTSVLVGLAAGVGFGLTTGFLWQHFADPGNSGFLRAIALYNEHAAVTGCHRDSNDSPASSDREVFGSLDSHPAPAQ